MTSTAKKNDTALPTFILNGVGKLLTLEFHMRADGAVEYRYCIERGNYPGFDGHWRVMSNEERRETIRMGGRVAEWLRSSEQAINDKKKGGKK